VRITRVKVNRKVNGGRDRALYRALRKIFSVTAVEAPWFCG
jgi:hypothetical protein